MAAAVAETSAVGELGRRAGAWLAAFALVVLAALTSAPAASADEAFDSWDVTYSVDASGAMRVRERIVYEFGGYRRHGIDRWIIVRERWDDDSDVVYEVFDVRVSSPTGAATKLDTGTTQQDGRAERLRIRVGDADRYLSGSSATYILEYTVRGAIRGSPAYDELYWDALGPDVPHVSRLTVTISVPGGVTEVICFAGAPGGKKPCSERGIVDGVARYRQDELSTGDVLTVGAMLQPGAVADNRPHLRTPRASVAAGVGWGALGATAVLAVVAIVVATRFRAGRDLRYLDLPAGVRPQPAQIAKVGPDPGIRPPVAFDPPDVPVAVAGYLMHGKVEPSAVGATLLGLAVTGAIQLNLSAKTAIRANPQVSTDPVQAVLLKRLFANLKQPAQGGPKVKLDASKRTAASLMAVQDRVKGLVEQQKLMTKVSKKVSSRGKSARGFVVLSAFIGFFVATVGGAIWLGPWGLLLGSPVIPIAVIAFTWLARRTTPVRTADGRALLDQVEGFREYLTTAEADQLEFEEGEDIYSKYVAWAALFGIVERWTRVCGELAAAGKIPKAHSWVVGATGFDLDFDLLHEVTRWSVHTPPSSGHSSSAGRSSGHFWSSSAGTSTGSSFSGGGFSGGGGGGGGAGGW